MMIIKMIMMITMIMITVIIVMIMIIVMFVLFNVVLKSAYSGNDSNNVNKTYLIDVKCTRTSPNRYSNTSNVGKNIFGAALPL